MRKAIILFYQNEIFEILVFFFKVDKWPETGFVKKLQRRKDGYFYYYNRARECPDKGLTMNIYFQYE